MSDLPEKIKAASDFLKPENLETLLLKYEGEVALLVIDVQKMFCDPQGRLGNAQTEEVSKRIQSLVPEFRKAGVPVYAVYFGGEKEASEIDFYKFRPAQEDTLVAKSDVSAFKSSDIKNTLQKDGKKLLLTCGFNLSACVLSTVMDARAEGFEVCLLRDLAGDDNDNARGGMSALLAMKGKDVLIESSDKVIEQLQARKNSPPQP